MIYLRLREIGIELNTEMEMEIDRDREIKRYR
jgi:hypothetical protein